MVVVVRYVEHESNVGDEDVKINVDQNSSQVAQDKTIPKKRLF